MDAPTLHQILNYARASRAELDAYIAAQKALGNTITLSASGFSKVRDFHMGRLGQYNVPVFGVPCVYCNAVVDGSSCRVEHIIPIKIYCRLEMCLKALHAGSMTLNAASYKATMDKAKADPRNLFLSCQRCNGEKSEKMPDKAVAFGALPAAASPFDAIRATARAQAGALRKDTTLFAKLYDLEARVQRLRRMSRTQGDPVHLANFILGKFKPITRFSKRQPGAPAHRGNQPMWTGSGAKPYDPAQAMAKATLKAGDVTMGDAAGGAAASAAAAAAPGPGEEAQVLQAQCQDTLPDLDAEIIVQVHQFMHAFTRPDLSGVVSGLMEEQAPLKGAVHSAAAAASLRHRGQIEQRVLCYYCLGFHRADNMHIDHLSAIHAGSSSADAYNDPDNLVPCCATCNTRKQDKPLDASMLTDLQVVRMINSVPGVETFMPSEDEMHQFFAHRLALLKLA